MSTLDDLFPDAKARREARVVWDDHHTVRRLEELFGGTRADLDLTHRASGRPALVAMVNAAVADAKPGAGAPPAPQPARKPYRRRIDVVSVATAALAVVALVTAGVVGGIQAATASPADDALRVLTSDEQTIDSVEDGLTAAQTQIADDVAAAQGQADALRTALEGVRGAPDPADIPPGRTEPPEDAGTIPIADGAALSAALASVDIYRSDLAAIKVPALPEPYQREKVDEDSLAAVAVAIDRAQLHLTDLDRATAAIRTVRTSLQSREDALAAQLNSFTATFPPTAQKAIDDSPDAGQESKDALTAAATTLAATGLMTPEGPASLQAYRTAAVALVADQVHQDRLREEREREQEREQRRRREQQQQQPVTPVPAPSPTPTDPPVDDSEDMPPTDEG